MSCRREVARVDHRLLDVDGDEVTAGADGQLGGLADERREHGHRGCREHLDDAAHCRVAGPDRRGTAQDDHDDEPDAVAQTHADGCGGVHDALLTFIDNNDKR